jgi:hypothetical protein
MQAKARKLYTLFILILIAGYGWLGFNLLTPHTGSHFPACLFKTVTSIPCPSCGSTRSIEYALHGDLHNALLTNPLGLVTLAIMVVMPAWIATDLIRRRESLYLFYRATEKKISRGIWAALLIILVLANWIWNILKDL